jgi:hypothetical protein
MSTSSTTAWLRKAYSLFSRNYKKNVQKLYIIHPTTFTRLILKISKVLVSEKFWRKLVQVDDVNQMHQVRVEVSDSSCLTRGYSLFHLSNCVYQKRAMWFRCERGKKRFYLVCPWSELVR